VVGKALFGARDQAVSSFAATLGRLCDALPAVAAALVDGEGETVDYAGSLSPYEIRVAGAEWQLVVASVALGERKAQAIEEIVVRARLATYAAFAISEGYVLVVQLRPRAFEVSRRAVIEAIREICAEAALSVPKRYFGEYWFRIDVRESRNDLRPRAIWMDQAYRPTTVIGRMSQPDALHTDRGYRVMLDNGNELTVVRERLGRWYREGEL
jgi:hypothetical protein